MNENMNIEQNINDVAKASLYKSAKNAAVIIAFRACSTVISAAAGIFVGRKVKESTENTAVAVTAGIGTAIVMDALTTKICSPVYNKLTKNIVTATSDIVECVEEVDLTEEEQEYLVSVIMEWITRQLN
jgi:hypothetical protein